MGMKCQKCGADNLYTAVFCVNCGEKIDLESVNINTMTKKEFKWGEFFKKVGKYIGIAVLLIVVAGIISVFIPSFGKIKAADPSKEAKAMYKVARGKAPAVLGPNCTFSSEDATNLLTNSVKKKFDVSGNVVPKSLSIRFLDGNRVKVVVTNKYYGFLSLDSVVVYDMKVGVPEVAEDNSEENKEDEEEKPAPQPQLIFTPSSGKIGNCPMLFGLKKIPARQISQLMGSVLADLKRCAKSVNTNQPKEATAEKPAEGEEEKEAAAPAKSNGSVTLGI